VLIPHNLKAIVASTDRELPRLHATFREYAEARASSSTPRA
jgi:hypothetical protein